MADIFVGQTLLTIKLDTELDLSTATALAIMYEKPDGTEGEFVGTIDDTTKIKYDVSSVNDLDVEGDWKFQAKATFATGIGYGDTVVYPVKDLRAL